MRFTTSVLLIVSIFVESISSHAAHADSASHGIAVRTKNPADSSSYEVEGYEAQNAEQSAEIIKGLSERVKADIAKDPSAKYEIVVRLGDSNQPVSDTALDREAYALGRHLAAVDPRITLSQSNIPLSPSLRQAFKRQHWFDKNYRMTFTLIRAVVSTGATTWTLMATSQLTLAAALCVGLVAGSMSGSLQWWSEEFYNGWVTKKSGLMTSVSNRLSKLNGWIMENDYAPPDQIPMLESARKWGASFAEKSDAWLRCYWAEVAYVVALGTAMSTLGIDGGFSSWTLNKIANDILLTSLMSTVMQDSWDLAITNNSKTQQREAIKTSDAIKRRTKGSYLMTGGISMVLMMMKLLHIPYIDATYVALATSGVVVYGYTLYRDWRSLKTPPDKTLSQRVKTSCLVLLQKI